MPDLSARPYQPASLDWRTKPDYSEQPYEPANPRRVEEFLTTYIGLKQLDTKHDYSRHSGCPGRLQYGPVIGQKKTIGTMPDQSEKSDESKKPNRPENYDTPEKLVRLEKPKRTEKSRLPGEPGTRKNNFISIQIFLNSR